LNLTGVFGRCISAKGRGERNTARGIRKIGVIEDVEDLPTELQSRGFVERRVFDQGQINISFWGAEHDISSGVSEGERRRHLEGRSVEPFLCGMGRSTVGIADQVRALSGTSSEFDDISIMRIRRV
jgi:hypothetical protein